MLIAKKAYWNILNQYFFNANLTIIKRNINIKNRIMTTKTKEVQQTRKLEYKFFDLQKFKVTKKGVDITHLETGEEGGKITKEGKAHPHPDLKTKMDELKLYMAARLGLLVGWDYSRQHLKSADDVLQGAIDGHNESVENCNVNGLTFVGEGDTVGVLITGSIKVPNGGSTGLAVPKITFSSDKLGYETEVEEICEDIKKEIYAYRYQHKKAQLDIENDGPDLFEGKKEDEPTE